jgi:hypothetical protein
MFIVVSFFLVIAVFISACVLCKHYAGGTCILHCALFNNYYTWLPSHQLQTPEEIGLSESFYTGTKAPLQIIMANEHDSMLFQPENDSGWSCGPFTIVKVLETLLQLERNGKTKILDNRAQFRLET